MSATLMLALAWNPVVGVPMLIVGVIVLALIWLFGQPKQEQGRRRSEPGAPKGSRREPSLGDDQAADQQHVDPRIDPAPLAEIDATPEQGQLDIGLRAELERLGATLSGDHAAPPPATATATATATSPAPPPKPAPRAAPKLADHVSSIINALRAPPEAGGAPAPTPVDAAATVTATPPAAPGAASLPKSDLGRRPSQLPVERIVTLFVVAREGMLFNGADLVVAADKAGLEYGDMGIYHRLVDGKRDQGPIFSVANMLKPGSFNLANLDALRTPGVSFFMTLPGPLQALDAWDAMLPTAQRLAELLDGLVLDEERNAVGRQCVAHIRDQLRAWDREHEGQW
jgi:cell division protein ZipA